jgi:hypothetical protein
MNRRLADVHSIEVSTDDEGRRTLPRRGRGGRPSFRWLGPSCQFQLGNTYLLSCAGFRVRPLALTQLFSGSRPVNLAPSAQNIRDSTFAEAEAASCTPRNI